MHKSLSALILIITFFSLSHTFPFTVEMVKSARIFRDMSWDAGVKYLAFLKKHYDLCIIPPLLMV